MSVSQLSLYNGALRICGETKLASLTEPRETRYTLDDVWNNGAINYMLEQGMWFFAMRASQFNSDPDIQPPFGYTKGFAKPDDWVKTAAMCSDPYFKVPVIGVVDEAGSWYSDADPLYVKYISSGTDYGANLGLWPQTFASAVEGYLAQCIAPKTTSGAARVVTIAKEAERLLTNARSKAAMNGSAVFPPAGTWSRARVGGGFGDRGSQSRLIG